MAKLKSIINKLQRALTMRGRYIMVNQNQFYFDEIDKICTKYVLTEKKEINGKMKNNTLLETFKAIDVVNFLVNLLNGGE